MSAMRLATPAGAIAAAVALTLAACGGSSRAETSAPDTVAAAAGHGLRVGVMFDGPALSSHVDLDAQMALAARSGSQSLRVAISWAAAQPSETGGIDFAVTDRVVLAAARHRLSLLPVVLYTPPWAGSGAPNSPPRDPATYGRFLAALVDRYGPRGSLWASHRTVPKVPVRMWQIWNEPDFTRYWAPQPFAASYVRLLAAAHAAIKAADPRAQVVLAGLPEFSWEYLAQILAVPGAAGDFELAAAHPYTAQPAGVMTILRRDRAALDAHGAAGQAAAGHRDHLAELAGARATAVRGRGQQGGSGAADRCGDADAGRRAARLHLAGVYWYTWMGDESPSRAPYAFNYAGLLPIAAGGSWPSRRWRRSAAPRTPPSAEGSEGAGG